MMGDTANPRTTCPPALYMAQQRVRFMMMDDFIYNEIGLMYPVISIL